MILRTCIAAVLASVPHIGIAATIQEGREACRNFDKLSQEMSTDELVDLGTCYGIADGVVQVMIYNCRLAPDTLAPKSSAPPSIGAAIQTFLNWSDAHPEYWGDRFVDGMMIAVAETFPCAE